MLSGFAKANTAGFASQIPQSSQHNIGPSRNLRAASSGPFCLVQYAQVLRYFAFGKNLERRHFACGKSRVETQTQEFAVSVFARANTW
jgi:hypothetical protein